VVSKSSSALTTGHPMDAPRSEFPWPENPHIALVRFRRDTGNGPGCTPVKRAPAQIPDNFCVVGYCRWFGLESRLLTSIVPSLRTLRAKMGYCRIPIHEAAMVSNEVAPLHVGYLLRIGHMTHPTRSVPDLMMRNRLHSGAIPSPEWQALR